FDFIFADSVKENLENVIFDCLYLKKEIVEQDEFDTKGIRNLLNAGHTVAHSIELLSGYTVMHGNAVAMGLYTEADISEKLGICDKDTSGRIKDTRKKAGLYFDIPYAPKDIANACLLDKKNKDSRIVFLLPEKNGKCREVKLSADELSRLL
ncbi:MAG: 3-dehydroquinate synthase, partial [Clostridia bacterium]|nr:3-dehydroquinate synthase [Clostridia bacterium]